METVSTVIPYQVLREGFGIFNAGPCPKVVQTTEGCNLCFFKDAKGEAIIVTMKQEARGEQEPHQSLCLAYFDFHIAVRNGTKPSGRGEVQFAPI